MQPPPQTLLPVQAPPLQIPLPALQVSGAQVSPSVGREQPTLSIVSAPATHAPALHVRGLQVRDIVPEVSQTSRKPPHAPNAPHVVPQSTPFVVRMPQLCVSMRGADMPQLPPEQIGSVQVRVCVPVVAHASRYAHVLHAEHIAEPHDVPPVVREQGIVSMRMRPVQLPVVHTRSVQVRVATPLSSHVSLKPAQPP